MDLMCCENISEKRAYVDPILLEPRVLKNLLKAEEKYTLSASNTNVKTDVTPHMIKIVAQWMKEVCEEQKCQEEVFLLAIGFMNRFLSVCCIKRNQLQLLGTTCMLVASKLRESSPLAAKLLIFYTDNSILLEELMSWELLVLSKLKWDISVVTPLDFIKHMMVRIPIQTIGIAETMVDGHVKTLVALCACEPTFWRYPPSMIAAACLVSALQGVDWLAKSNGTLDALLHKIHTFTNIEPDCLLECLNQIDRMVDEAVRNLSQREISRPKEFTPPLQTTDKSVEIETASTPTDVHEVDF